MKKQIMIAVTILFAANTYAQVRPKVKVETKRTNTAEAGKGPVTEVKPSTESFKQLEARSSQPSEGKVNWTEQRVSKVIESTGASIPEMTRRNLIAGAEKSLEIRQAINTVDSIVTKLTSKGGRVPRNAQDLVEVALEWLAEARNEPNANDIHLIFEDAIKSSAEVKGDYAKEVAGVLRDSLQLKQQSRGLSLLEATRRILKEKYDITEQEFKGCKRS